MNGKKKKNKKLVLDSGKISHYPIRDLDIKSSRYKEVFYLKNFIFLISYFLERN